MSFASDSENLVNQLIQAEYENACNKWGNKYHSLHEGYAVLLEEIEETEREFLSLKSNLSRLWYNIKNNDDELVSFYQDVLENNTIQGLQELAQVGVVLMKIKNTLGGENGN